MTAKTLKIINGVFWALSAITLNIGVVIEWQKQGSPLKGLILGCIVFTSFCGCLWYVIHNHINEVNEE